MFTVVIIVILGLVGAAALAMWLVDERGKMRGWHKVRDDWREFDKTMAEFDYVYPPKPPPRPWTEEKIEKWLAKYPKYDGPPLNVQIDTPPLQVVIPSTKISPAEAVRNVNEAIEAVTPPTPEELQQRAKEIVYGYKLHMHEPTIANITDRESIERIKAFVDDSVRNPRTVEIVEADWHPLPMEELRREWED